MDNEEVKGENMRVLMGKDVENKSDYNDSRHDYVAPGELTVTITLGEFRSLIKSQVEECRLQSDNYDLRRAKDNLQEQLDACRKELTVCKKALESFQRIPEAASTMTPEVSTKESMMPGEPVEELVFVEDAGEN